MLRFSTGLVPSLAVGFFHYGLFILLFQKNVRFGNFPVQNNVRNIQTSVNRLAEAKNDLVLTFASANRTFYKDTPVKEVEFYTTSGACGVLVQHVPILGCLKASIVNVTEIDNKVNKYMGT